jgi:N-acetylglucosamine malate deacetylase 1
MNVLVVAPHPDDESIGCGGAIGFHRANGSDVTIVWLTSGEAGVGPRSVDDARRIREAEALRAADVLGVTDTLFQRLPDGRLDHQIEAAAEHLTGLISRLQPHTIYAPHAGEDHRDHRAAHTATANALEASGHGADLWCYEVWTPLSSFDSVLPIDDHMDGKLRAVRCYDSQVERYRFDRAAEGLGAYRGALAGGCRYAEVFARRGATGSPPI